MDKLVETQKILDKQLSHLDDKTFVQLVDCFCYDTPTKSTRISKILERFIEDNDLFEVVANARYDREHPEGFFLRSSLSQRQTLENIKVSLVSLSHNRFRFHLQDSKS